MYFVRFHPEVTSCLLSRGKTKYATLGMRLWWKYIRNYLLVYQLTSHFLPYLQNYKEFEAEISDLQLEKYGLSFETKKYTTSGWARGDENVIGIRAFKSNIRLVQKTISKIIFKGDKIGWNLEQKIPQQQGFHLACLYAHNAVGFSHTLWPFSHCEEHRGQAFIEGGQLPS